MKACVFVATLASGEVVAEGSAKMEPLVKLARQVSEARKMKVGAKLMDVAEWVLMRQENLGASVVKRRNLRSEVMRERAIAEEARKQRAAEKAEIKED